MDPMSIDVEALRRDLSELIAIPSVGGSTAEVEIQRWCADRLDGLGLEVDHWALDLEALRADDDYPGEEVDRAEAWGCVGVSGRGAPALVLNGHVDVVPAGDPSLWSSYPFALSETDGIWTGRGACDMKGGVAAILAAVRAQQGVPLARPFAVHSVIGEEDGGIGTFATLQRGHRGDVCLIAEPTAGELITANAGSLTFRLEVRGRATHGSMRHTGVSAIEKLEVLQRALRSLEAERNVTPPEPFGPLPWPISIGILRAGDWASTVPDVLVAEGRYGVMPGESFAEAEAAFEHAVARAAATDPWLAAEPPVVSWPGGRFAAGQLPDGHPFLGELGDAVASVDDTRPATAGAPYGSDLRQYAAAGIPTAQYGPGDIAGAHAVGEQVAIDDVVRCAEAYVALIRHRCA